MFLQLCNGTPALADSIASFLTRGSYNRLYLAQLPKRECLARKPVRILAYWGNKSVLLLLTPPHQSQKA